jgi:purine nucleosidase
MDFPVLADAVRLELLKPPVLQSGEKLRMVLDTDTYNEIDDQFAVVQALLSPERLQVEAIYAAPFHNSRSEGPGDGMQKSYEEILRLLDRLEVDADGLVHKGSVDWLRGPEMPQESAAAHDLVERAKSGDGPLYVVAIGALTNVASALVIAPEIVDRLVIVWLGGHAHSWPETREFNLQGDLRASQLVFDCGAALVQIPCMGVASHLLTTLAEMERFVSGRGAIGDYLVEIFKAYHRDHFAWSKVIWDISAVGYLLDPSWVPTELVHSPLLTDQYTYSCDRRRHLIRVASQVRRDAIFGDFFRKLEGRN